MSRALRSVVSGFLLVILSAAATRAEEKTLLLLGQSPDGHKPGTHEYLPGVKLMAKCLANTPDLKLKIVNADNPWSDGPELLGEVDGVVLFVSEGARWIHDDPRRLEAFAKLAERGGGLVVLHWGMGTREAKNIQGFLNLFGGCHGGPDRKYKVVDQARVQVAAEKHPVMTGIKPLTLREEFYYKLKFVKSKTPITPLLKTKIDGDLETVCWAWQRPDGGRSFGFSGGHFHNNWQQQAYRRLMAQAVLWTLDLPIPENGLAVPVDGDDLKLK